VTRTKQLDSRRQRAGFTLVELLVVIAIVAILISLAAAGIFQYLEAQTRSNTETTIRVVDKILRQQIDAVISKAKDEPLPRSVQALATNDFTINDDQQKRARAIWTTLRLIQEFPMTYQEALNPTGTIAAGSRTADYTNLLKDLPPKSTYLNVLKAAPTPYAGSAVECATLLLLALQQNRGGVMLTADKLPASLGDSNIKSVKMLVDGWGNPLVFYRFPIGNPADPSYGNSAAFELDQTRPASIKYRNPVDPDGALLNPSWNSLARYDPSSGIYWFEKLCHHVRDSRSYYAPFVIVSSGKDGKFGLNGELFGPPSIGHSADMSLTSAATAAQANDNIYSFRLRVGARGD
jgi:prepilin-type N-terminal cleavage/methylation domain-containing protein